MPAKMSVRARNLPLRNAALGTGCAKSRGHSSLSARALLVPMSKAKRETKVERHLQDQERRGVRRVGDQRGTDTAGEGEETKDVEVAVQKSRVQLPRYQSPERAQRI